MSALRSRVHFLSYLWPVLGLLATLWMAVPSAFAQPTDPVPRSPTATAPRRAAPGQTLTPAEAQQPTATLLTNATAVPTGTLEHPFAPRRPTSEATATSPPAPTATQTEIPATATSVTTATHTSTPVPPTATTTAASSSTLGVSGWFTPGARGETSTVTPTLGTSTPTGTATRDIPPPPPIRYAGVPTTSFEAEWLGPNYLWLGVPHRTQLDGTVWAQSNCGPSSLGMVLGAYGLSNYPTDALRGEVNRLMGNFDPDSGTSLPALATVARRAGLHPMDLNKRWTLQDVRTHLSAGRPIITLVRYADLPGNGYFNQDTNHYVVLSGFNGDQIIYNDAAYAQGRGRALLIAPEVLERGWRNSNIPFHGVAFALNPEGAGVIGRPRTFDPEFDVVREEGDDDSDISAFAAKEPIDQVEFLPSEDRAFDFARAELPLVLSARGATTGAPSRPAPSRPAPTPAATVARFEPASLPDPGRSQLALSTYLLLVSGVWLGARVRRDR